MVELATTDMGNMTAIFAKDDSDGDTDVITYNTQEITIFLHGLGIYGDKVKVCLEILEKYLEINEIAKKAIIENFHNHNNEDLNNIFEGVFESLDLNVIRPPKGITIEEYYIKEYVENWKFPYLLFGIIDNEIAVYAEYILTEEWGEFIDSLSVKMDEKLNITGFDYWWLLKESEEGDENDSY
jgi:hypothetical protein